MEWRGARREVMDVRQTYRPEGHATDLIFGLIPSNGSIREQPLRDRQIQLRQPFQFVQCDVLVDLVDAGVHRTDLNHFRAEWRNEAAVRGAAAGAELGFEAGVLAAYLQCDAAQFARSE